LFDCGGMEARILRVDPVAGSAKPAGDAARAAQGVVAASAKADTGPKEEAHLSITVAANAKPGAYGFRVYGPTGLSNYALLMLVETASLVENEAGSSRDHPQHISISAAMNGRIAHDGEIDYYELDVPAAQLLQFEIVSAAGAIRSIPPVFVDPELTVYQRKANWFDPAGLERVEIGNESFTFYNPPTNETQIFRRPRFVHNFAHAGKYLLAVRSASGAGGPDHVYLFRVAPAPTSIPPSLSRWLPIRPVCQDPGDWDERTFERELRPDRTAQLTARTVTPGAKNAASQQIPTIAEKEPNETPQQATMLPIPALVEGAIQSPGDLDTYRIQVRSGEKVALELQAPEHTPPYFSPLLTVFDAQGGKLYDNIYRKIGGDGDDWIKSIEPKMTLTFDKAGDYYLQIRDLTERTGGPLFRYRLVVRAQMPHAGEISACQFSANGGESSEQRLNLSPGDIRKLTIVTGMEEGFEGEIALSVENLPPGVEVLPGANTTRDIPLFPGERRALMGAVGTERYRPVRLATTLMLAVHRDAAPTAKPQFIRVIARPVVKNSLGAPIAGPRIPLMVVK
jgi:hypothetical protein